MSRQGQWKDSNHIDLELLQDVIARMAVQPQTINQLEGGPDIFAIIKAQQAQIGAVTFGLIRDY